MSDEDRVVREVTVEQIGVEDKPYNPVTIRFYKDGAASITNDDGESWIYLYPEQLKKFMEVFVK